MKEGQLVPRAGYGSTVHKLRHDALRPARSFEAKARVDVNDRRPLDCSKRRRTQRFV